VVDNLLVNAKVQNALVNLLKYAFTSNTDFKYTTDIKTTKIGIYKAHPKVMPAYPIVIVNYPVADVSQRTFGDDLLYEAKGDWTFDGMTLVNGLCFSVYGGLVNSKLSVVVVARTAPERELIIDWIITYLRHVYRSYLDQWAIDIQGIGREAEIVQPYGSELIYLSQVSMDMYYEWNRILSPEGHVLMDYNLDANIILPDGTTFAF